jgi:hypothetical protein
MRRRLLIPLCLALTAILVLGVAVLALGSLDRVNGPTYTLAQVEAGLRRHPSAWVGRTIRLEAVVTSQPLGCPSGPSLVCQIVSPLTVYSSDILLVSPEPDPFLDRLRALPAIGPLLPGPQPSSGDGTFRVTIRAAPTGYLCPRRPCFEAVLPDAGPEGAAADTVGSGPVPAQQGLGGSVSGPTPAPSR